MTHPYRHKYVPSSQSVPEEDTKSDRPFRNYAQHLVQRNLSSPLSAGRSLPIPPLKRGDSFNRVRSTPSALRVESALLSRSLVLGQVRDRESPNANRALPDTAAVLHSDQHLATPDASRRPSHVRNKSADASFFSGMLNTEADFASTPARLGEQPTIRVFDSIDALADGATLFPNCSVIARREGNKTEFIVMPPQPAPYRTVTPARSAPPTWPLESPANSWAGSVRARVESGSSSRVRLGSAESVQTPSAQRHQSSPLPMPLSTQTPTTSRVASPKSFEVHSAPSADTEPKSEIKKKPRRLPQPRCDLRQQDPVCVARMTTSLLIVKGPQTSKD